MRSGALRTGCRVSNWNAAIGPPVRRPASATRSAVQPVCAFTSPHSQLCNTWGSGRSANSARHSAGRPRAPPAASRQGGGTDCDPPSLAAVREHGPAPCRSRGACPGPPGRAAITNGMHRQIPRADIAHDLAAEALLEAIDAPQFARQATLRSIGSRVHGGTAPVPLACMPTATCPTGSGMPHRS